MRTLFLLPRLGSMRRTKTLRTGTAKSMPAKFRRAMTRAVIFFAAWPGVLLSAGPSAM